MTSLQESQFNTNFISSSVFTQKLETLQNQLPAILDDFITYYRFYNKNPNYAEYQQMFENIKNNLNDLNTQLFMLINNVESNTQDLNNRLINLNELILNSKQKNNTLKQKLGIIEQKNNSATEMIHNYTQIYDIGYVRNWGLFFSIIISSIALSKVFKSTS
uniref:t-SNARE coiled-coil homology domain-containing protein n=1 Tax=viral metagenome TaxID=1070528 RepID=A0A6C0EQX4_9ZZZZ